jgi:hypothetical protein
VKEAMEFLRLSIDEEITTLGKNNTWDLVSLHDGPKPIG